MKKSTKQLTFTAVLLAICIASQFLKNVSVYLTGPIVNAAIILVAYYCGMGYAILLSIVTPVTSFLITGSPIMSAIPAIIPCVMAGNAILAIVVSAFHKNKSGNGAYFASVGIGAVLKGAFMGVLISLLLLPNYLPEKLLPKLTALQMQFSLTQLFTAVIGGVYAWIVMKAVRTDKIK